MDLGLIKNLTAAAAIAAYRIVEFAAAAGEVQTATASTDMLLGVTGPKGADAGDRIDVCLDGIRDIEFGGTVTQGAFVTADANGKAVAAAPGAGVNAYIIGQAMVSGVDGDIGSIKLAPGRIQG